MLGILGLIAGAIAVAGIVYAVAKITIKWLKTWKTKKQNKIVAVEAEEMLKAIAKDPSIAHANLDELGDDDVILAEYDADDDSIEKVEIGDEAGEIDGFLNRNNGIMVFD